MRDPHRNVAPQLGDERSFRAKAAIPRGIGRAAHEQRSAWPPLAIETQNILIAQRQELAARPFAAQFGGLEKGQQAAVLSRAPHRLVQAWHENARKRHVTQRIARRRHFANQQIGFGRAR